MMIYLIHVINSNIGGYRILNGECSVCCASIHVRLVMPSYLVYIVAWCCCSRREGILEVYTMIREVSSVRSTGRAGPWSSMYWLRGLPGCQYLDY